MKRLCTLSFVLASLFGITACESGPQKPKPVPPTVDIDGKPWNRPHSWENNSRFGGMMPQSR
jgi:hypothetical protein